MLILKVLEEMPDYSHAMKKQSSTLGIPQRAFPCSSFKSQVQRELVEK